MNDILLSPTGDIVLFENTHLSHAVTVHFILGGQNGIAFHFNFSKNSSDLLIHENNENPNILSKAIFDKWLLETSIDTMHGTFLTYNNPYSLGKATLGQWLIGYDPSAYVSTRCSFTFLIRSQEKTYCEKVISDTAELKQRLVQVLKTSLGELAHDITFGSRIEYHRHCNLRSTSNLTHIKETAKKAFDQILTNYLLDVTYSPQKAIGYHSQMLTFTIHINDETIIINEEV